MGGQCCGYLPNHDKSKMSNSQTFLRQLNLCNGNFQLGNINKQISSNSVNEKQNDEISINSQFIQNEDIKFNYLQVIPENFQQKSILKIGGSFSNLDDVGKIQQQTQQNQQQEQNQYQQQQKIQSPKNLEPQNNNNNSQSFNIQVISPDETQEKQFQFRNLSSFQGKSDQLMEGSQNLNSSYIQLGIFVKSCSLEEIPQKFENSEENTQEKQNNNQLDHNSQAFSQKIKDIKSVFIQDQYNLNKFIKKANRIISEHNSKILSSNIIASDNSIIAQCNSNNDIQAQNQNWDKNQRLLIPIQIQSFIDPTRRSFKKNSFMKIQNQLIQQQNSQEQKGFKEDHIALNSSFVQNISFNNTQEKKKQQNEMDLNELQKKALHGYQQIKNSLGQPPNEILNIGYIDIQQQQDENEQSDESSVKTVKTVLKKKLHYKDQTYKLQNNQKKRVKFKLEKNKYHGYSNSNNSNNNSQGTNRKRRKK